MTRHEEIQHYVWIFDHGRARGPPGRHRRPGPRQPFMPEPLDPLDKSADDGWLTPPEIKAVFDKRQAGAAKAAP